MNKDVIDALLTAMVASSPGVSDLLFAAGRPPMVEEHGLLQEFPIDTADGALTAAQIENVAAHLMQGEERLAG